MPKNTRRYFEESEDLLKGRSPESYGSEFAALMRSKLGSPYQHLASPAKLGLVSLVGDPKGDWNAAGVNFLTGLESTKDKQEMETALQPVLEGQPMPEGKRIFGIGRGADARTYAHELRHEDIKGELQNRMLDLIHSSTSLPAYKANVNQVYGYLTDFDPEKKNTPVEEKEKRIFEELNYYLKRAPHDSDLGFFTKAMAGDWLNKNLEVNKAGAVGAFLDGKKLPNSMLKYRAKLPFLNFIGRLEEPKTAKKASGGSVENTTHDRKII